MDREKVFIFPNNYNRKEKFLGFIDYRALVLIGTIGFILFCILRSISFDLKLKVSFFVAVISMPTIILLIGINGENPVDVLKYMAKYYFRDRVYVWKKTEERLRYEKIKVRKNLVADKKC